MPSPTWPAVLSEAWRDLAFLALWVYSGNCWSVATLISTPELLSSPGSLKGGV